MDKNNFSKGDRRTQGFTLVEVMFASALSLLLFMTLFETISFCRRASSNIKWRLTADAIAFDEAWEIFNKQTSWFDTTITEAKAEWTEIAADRTSVWYKQTPAYLYRSIIPDEIPANYWVIRTNVQWPIPESDFMRLSKDYEIIRYRNDRNLFKAKK